MPVGNIPTGFYMCTMNPVVVNVTLNNKSGTLEDIILSNVNGKDLYSNSLDTLSLLSIRYFLRAVATYVE